MNKKTPKATHSGALVIDDFRISCAVLEDGRRVLVERSVASALNKKGGGAYWKKKKGVQKGALLPEYVSARYLEPYMTEKLKATLLDVISYINTNGQKRTGIDASVLPDICDLWIKASKKGALKGRQIETAEKAYILTLVDEATGRVGKSTFYDKRLGPLSGDLKNR